MMTYGALVDNALRAIRRTNDEEDRRAVGLYVNKFYFDLCRDNPIKELRRTVTVDAASGGVWLPSNMAGILRVVDDDDAFEYLSRDREGVDDEEIAYRYYDYVPTDGPLATGTDAVLLKDGTTFTAASLSDDHTGEYIKFGSEMGYYLLSAEKTFAPAYGGDNLNNVRYVIRPKETRKLVLLDESGDEQTSRTVQVHYWVYPEPLYVETDITLLPSDRALELLVMKETLVVLGKRQISGNTLNSEIDEAMARLRKLCPPINIPLRAKDRGNKPFTIDTSPFGER